MDLLTRFWNKVDKTGECWEWTAGTVSKGYGAFYLSADQGSRQVGAHRFAYELLVDEIPKGMHIDHLCKNKRCVNPEHLEVVTPGENVLRGDGPSAQNARKSQCPRGHDYRTRARGRKTARYCPACENAARRERGAV